jgi:hypothetical protein
VNPPRRRGEDSTSAASRRQPARYETIPLPGMPTAPPGPGEQSPTGSSRPRSEAGGSPTAPRRRSPAGGGTTRPTSGARSNQRSAPPTTDAKGNPLPQLKAEHANAPELRAAAARFALGRPTASTSAQGGLADALRSVYGASPRDPDRPDLRAAADDLGMSTRQLRRWASGESRPRSDNPRLQKLRRRVRESTTTKAGRRRAMGRTPAPMPQTATGIKVGGVQGVRSSNDDQYRDRNSEIDLTPEEYAELQQLWVENGHAGLTAGLHAHYSDHYVSNWHFESIDSITWSDKTFGGR